LNVHDDGSKQRQRERDVAINQEQDRRDELEQKYDDQIVGDPKGRALITRGFREHAAAMENAVSVLSKKERLTLLRVLKKMGKHAAETRK
jgi:hypothetical protein